MVAKNRLTQKLCLKKALDETKMSYRHDWLQKKIYEKPSLAGIEETGLVNKVMEMSLLTHGHVVVAPDLAFQSLNELYLVEVKGNPSKWCMDKYLSQANRIQRWYDSNGIAMPDLRLVHPRQPWYENMFEMLGDLEIIKYQ